VKKIGFFYLCVIICAIVQATMLDYIRLWSVKPDLLLLCCVVVGLTLSLRDGLYLGILAGFLKDILSLNHYGISTLFFPLVVFLVFKLSTKIATENSSLSAMVVFFVVILNEVVSKILLEFFGVFIPAGVFLRVIILEALYTAIISILVFKMKGWIFFRLPLHPEERSDEGSPGRNQFN